MIDKRKIIICTAIFGSILLGILFLNPYEGNAETFHTDAEIALYKKMLGGGDEPIDSLLPYGFNTLFAGSGECVECHGPDPEGIASIDLFGNDVNLVDDWRATMMANSAKDPFWRAKVSHEVLLHPEHQATIETKCTACHAPMGHFEAFHQGQNTYTIAEMLEDSLALDGVSCLACHKQTNEMLGDLHSGDLRFDTARVAYGPYVSPLESPMLEATDYTPVYSEHISDAGICAGCHTLVNQTIDYDGNITDNHFVEQATYHEWLNSEYNEVTNTSCQNCHMPALEKGEFIIVAGHETEPRSPFYLHELVGANTMMLTLLKNNREVLGLGATAAQFDDAISATVDMLRNQTLSLKLDLLERTPDTAYFELKVTNKAGHKFPSGYPARRAFVEFVVANEAGDTLFVSGKTDPATDYEIVGHDEGYEPHYQIITSENQAQIYEFVMTDINGEVTKVLERGYAAVKDNRLAPKGFTTSHSAYDTTRIVGLALSDSDFNFEDGEEGSGTDKIQYHIPLAGVTENLIASASVYYQAIPPKEVAEMFAASTTEIDDFKAMYEAAERAPFLMKSRSVDVGSLTSIDTESIQEFLNQNNSKQFVTVYQDINKPQTLHLKSNKVHDLYLYDINGRLVRQWNQQQGQYELFLNPSLPKGIYVLKILGKKGQIQNEKISF